MPLSVCIYFVRKQLFTTKRHIDLITPHYLHAFVHLVPPIFANIPLFTCYTQLLENVIKHTYLHAFVQCHKTSLFTCFCACRPAPITPWSHIVHQNINIYIIKLIFSHQSARKHHYLHAFVIIAEPARKYHFLQLFLDR